MYNNKQIYWPYYVEVQENKTYYALINRFNNLNLYIWMHHNGLHVPKLGESAMCSLPVSQELINKDIYTKEDVKILFSLSSEKKSLGLMHYFVHLGYGFKLGKSYYISRANLERFLKEAVGIEIEVPC